MYKNGDLKGTDGNIFLKNHQCGCFHIGGASEVIALINDLTKALNHDE